MTDTTATATTKISLEIGGMTCASCAARIAKRLNKLDGVQASVNYATERATLTTPDGISTEDVIAEIEAIGYTARIPGSASPPAAGDDGYDHGPDDSEREVRALRHRVIGTEDVPIVVEDR